MPADARTYIKVHDGIADHPKVEGLSDRAFRLLIETWCWCSRHLTDGEVPRATWVKRGTARTRGELLAARLVEDFGEVFIMHDYTEHQRTAYEVSARREVKRRAGVKGNHQRWHTGPHATTDPTCEYCSAGPGGPPPHDPGSGSQVGSQVGSVVGDRSDNGRNPLEVEVEVEVEKNPRGPVKNLTPDRARNDHRAPTPPHGPAPSGPNAVLAQRAVAAAGIGGKFGQATVNRLAHEAAKLLDGGVQGTDVSAGLIRWKSSPGKGSALLAELVNDVVRERDLPPTSRHLRAVNAAQVSNAPCGDYWQD